MSTTFINPIQPYFRICTQENYQAKYVNRDGISHFYRFTLNDVKIPMSRMVVLISSLSWMMITLKYGFVEVYKK